MSICQERKGLLTWNKKYFSSFLKGFSFKQIKIAFFGGWKSEFKQQHAQNAAKSANVNVLELLKLQNVLCPQPWLRES